MISLNSTQIWPELPLLAWHETYVTLQLWLQIVGKVRLKEATPLNHCWQSTFYVTARGLTTSPISSGQRIFEVQFDFISHSLEVNTIDGNSLSMPLSPMPVADFYGTFMDLLRRLDLDILIWPVPVEMPNPVPFPEDRVHRAYDREYVNKFWHIMAQSSRVLELFRSRFIGKCSPVHFFWGAFDLAVTRFSGRRAPKHPSMPFLADFVTQEAYSHEVSSCGFWPGGGPVPEPLYYSYAYPEPIGFKDVDIETEGAFYSPELGEFILPYEAVRQAPNPDEKLLKFLQGTYEAAAQKGNWDRQNLERPVTL